MRRKFAHGWLTASCVNAGKMLALSAGLAGLAHGGELSEDVYLSEMPVVLTISRLAQPLDEAPAAVTVIDRQMIKDSGAWDLAEIFRLVPGMYVAYHATDTYTTDTTVSYHGLDDAYAHRMQVLVDGHSVYSPLFGGTPWSDIPVALDDIERIEVTRGPNSASYGANAFMGTINIVTRHPAETQGTFLSLSGGRGRQEGVARLGGRNGDLAYRLTVGVRNDKGENSKIVDYLSQGGGWDNNKMDDKQIRLLTLRTDYRINTSDELEFQFGYNGGDRQEGWPNAEMAQEARRVDNRFELLHWRRALPDGGELSVQYYHALESSTANLFDIRDNTYTRGDASADRYDLEVQHTILPNPATRLVWGGSVRYDKTYAPYYTGDHTPEPFHLSRLFGNLEWRARPDLLFNVGAMAENNSYTDTDVTPRVAANWHFLPGHTLRISHATATRTPIVFEKKREQLYRGIFAFGELKPERIASSEIGYLGKFAGLNADFRLFHDRLNDLVALKRSAMLNGNLNSGNAVLKGVEAQLRWDIGERTRLIYGLAHTKITSRNEDNISYTSSAPTLSQSLMLSHRFAAAWSASLTGYQVSDTHLPGADAGPDENRRYYADGYRRWDGRLAYRFHTGATNGELAVIVQNLADAQYFEYRHDNEPLGRTAWLNLKLEL